MNDWIKHLQEWVAKNSKLALFFIGVTVLIVATQCASAADLKGYMIMDGQKWWLFYQEGKIVKCLNNPGAVRVKCEIGGVPVECENLTAEEGFIGACK